MVEQLKAVFHESTTYATRIKGSTRVVLVWKFNGEFSEVRGGMVEHDHTRPGETLRSYMERTFLGDTVPVTGLPGHR